MDNWKLGEGENELFKDYDDGSSKKGFSLGEPNEDFSYKTNDKIFSKKENVEKEAKFNGGKKNGFKKIFYIILGIAALLSALYLYKTLFLGNHTNIKLFDLKTTVYKSNVLPENNLLITGYLINKNKFPVSYVKLTCKLYSTKNIVLLTKHVYAGNFIRVKKLKNISNVAINMKLENKEGRNMSDIEILPNHPIRFMVVFFDINPNSKNYSVSIEHFYEVKK